MWNNVLKNHKIMNQLPDHLSIPEGPINLGYGEYYLFDLTGSKISKNIYDVVYQIFDNYSLARIVNSASTNDPVVKSRFQIVRDKVKSINGNLEVGFIPRVLYELICIRKCIKEDIREGNRCKYAYKSAQKEILKNPDADQEIKLVTAARKCWHLKIFADESDNQDECVRNFSFRLNQAIVKTLCPKPGGLTFLELKQKVQNEINYLENYYNKCTELYPHFFDDDNGESLTLNLSPKAHCFMGIKSKSDAQIILNALAVECSQLAQTSFLLYRGAKDHDSVVKSGASETGNEKCYCLSYGTGLYAGCVYDSMATAFYYMRKEQAKAFVIPVPFDMLNRSVFYIPPTNAITQLFGAGEDFHGMTKKWKGGSYWLDVSFDRKDPKVVESDLEKKEFLEMFQTFSAKAIKLN